MGSLLGNLVDIMGVDSLCPLPPFFLSHTFSASGNRHKFQSAISKAEKGLRVPSNIAFPFLIELS